MDREKIIIKNKTKIDVLPFGQETKVMGATFWLIIIRHI